MVTTASDREQREAPAQAFTAEGLLRRRAHQRPGGLALVDAANGEGLGLKSRRLTYGEADAAINCLSRFFIEFGLRPGERVVIQLPNSIEQTLTILAAWRAGLVVGMLPFLWRRTEIESACAALAPQALIGAGRFAGECPVQTLCQVAAAQISVRFVFGFGGELPDGVTALDEVLQQGRAGETIPVAARPLTGAAMITFTARRLAPLVPIVRTEEELLAHGAMTVLALELTSRDAILSAYPPTGPAGLGLALMPWLVAGCTLVQHQPFDYDGFVGQLIETQATMAPIPASVIESLVDDSVLQRDDCKLKRLICVSSPHDRGPDLVRIEMPLFEAQSLGDLACSLRQRVGDTGPSLIPRGDVHIGGAEGTVFLETTLGESGGEAGELRLRGPVVPPSEDGPLAPDPYGFVGSGLFCVADAGGYRVASDPELLHHGGFLIAAAELDALYQSYPGVLDAACCTLPDPIIGDRIFAAIVPRSNQDVSLHNLQVFLSHLEVAPYKLPDRLLVVKLIPRNADGVVLRDQILSEVTPQL